MRSSLVAMVAALAALSACSGSAPNLPTKADFAAYSFAEGVCLETEQTKADWRTCVTQARADFCVKFPAVCPSDGGAE